MKIFYIVLGFIGLGLGFVGVVLPLLPATPFLLVAAYCFGKSSSRLSRWFRGTKLYQKNLASFVSGKGMTVKAKIRVFATVTFFLSIAAFCMRNVSYGFLIIGAVWLIHLIAFVFFIKTAEEDGA